MSVHTINGNKMFKEDKRFEVKDLEQISVRNNNVGGISNFRRDS